MKSIEIKGTVRTDVGKKATHELRKNNGVPCVLSAERRKRLARSYSLLRAHRRTP